MKKKSKLQVGDRKNQSKLRWRNFPLWLITPLIEVAAAGELKYTTYNFLKGQYVNNCLDSLKRHLEKFENPYTPDIDEETGCSHMGAVAWNALVVCFVMKYRPDLDDRYKTK